MSEALPEACLDQLFRAARTHNTWQDRDVPDELLHSIVDLLKLGPTSANCSPARFVFVKSPEAKQRLSDAGFQVEDTRQLWGADRAFAIAPGGHRVELMAAPPPPKT